MQKKEITQISNILVGLERYVREKGYHGYDPYDALNSKYIRLLNNKFAYLAFTQLFVYSPLNLRSLFKIERGINPKAMGLFLQAYCGMYRTNLIGKKFFESIYYQLVNLLIKSSSKGYSGHCWGFNFDWQDLTRYSKKGLPTIVITSYVGNAFLDLYDITLNKEYLEIAESCCDFILNDLNITEEDSGICFSYTTIDQNVVHNANLLGAALLARVHSLNKCQNLLKYSEKAFDFSISYQKENGAWAYSRNIGEERNQIDFHQGFILESIMNFIKYVNPLEDKYKISLIKGAQFYMETQFDKSGSSLWRLPKRWPIDIHHQAQGIITCCKLFNLTKNEIYINFAHNILIWTNSNMLSKEGYYFFQKWPFFLNKIDYIRWGQAWMMLALTEFIYSKSLKGV